MLGVFDVNGEEKTLSWKIPLSLKPWLNKIFVSNDGKHVVVLDRAMRPQGQALVFYNKEKGKIKRYSDEEVLKLSQKVTSGNGKGAFPCYSFFHHCKGLTYFCSLVLQSRQFHQLIWNATTGEQIEVNQTLSAGIRKQARECFRKDIMEGGNYINKQLACLFFLNIKRREDRALIEKLLADEYFVTNPMWNDEESTADSILEKVGIRTSSRAKLEYFFAESGMREVADKALSEWDGKVQEADFSWSWGRGYVYYCLGEVSVKVILPAKPKKLQNLWVYLVPESVERAEWHKKRPIHYLFADFDGWDVNYKIGRTVACVFGGVTPGKYWVKVVWDRKKPFYNEDDEFYRPEKGDYESVVSPVIEVKAGQTVDVGKIKCNKKVKRK
jgi:hypothetical protein